MQVMVNAGNILRRVALTIEVTLGLGGHVASLGFGSATRAKGASIRGWQCVLAVRLAVRLAGAWLALASA